MASNHFYLRISAGKEGFMETMNVVEKRAVELNEVLEKRGSGFQVQYRKVTKNNCILDGYTLQSDKYNCVPTLYPDEILLERSNEEIAGVLEDAFKKEARNIDTSLFISRARILSGVRPKLVSGMNIENLKNIGIMVFPCMDDLAVYFFVTVPEFSTDGVNATVSLTNEVIRQSGLTNDAVKAAAIRNVVKDYKISDIGDVLKGLLGEMSETSVDDSFDPGIRMLVVTNHRRLNGAAVILNEEVRSRLHEMLGEEFIIIPSSIHEIICIKRQDDCSLEDIKEMVVAVNQSTVSIEDRLSDSVYGCKNGEISRLL